MRQRRLLLVLVMALGSGGLAGYLALSFLSQRSGEPVVDRDPVEARIAVAARDLPLGTVVKREDVKVIQWPAGTVPEGITRSVEEVVGRGLITPVRLNEPFLDTKLATREEGGGLPIVIPEGMRAVSVQVDEVIGVAGFVLPGTMVDVLVTLDPLDDARDDPGTRVILQNVQTLAAGQTIQRTENGEPQTVAVITLLVTPEQAEVLTLAATEGRIQLALRNTLDGDTVETLGMRLSALLKLADPAAPAPAPSARIRPTRVVEMYQGASRSVVTF